MALAQTTRASSLAMLREAYGSSACVSKHASDADAEDAEVWPSFTAQGISCEDQDWESDEDDCLENEWDACGARTDILRLERAANFGKIQPTCTTTGSATALISYKEVQAWIAPLQQVADVLDVLQPLENRAESKMPTLLQKRSQGSGGKDLVQHLRAMPFDFNTTIHFRMLRTVYTKLTLNKCCPSIGGHWEVIGFQGGDPRTDLNRSGGVLNVLHLFYFVTQHLDLATACFQLSQNDQQDFPLACISVNITSMVNECLSAGRFSALCNKESTDLGVLEMTCRLHSAGLAYFCSRWRSQKRTIMHTEQTRNEVKALLDKKPSKLLEELAEASGSSRSKKSTAVLSVPEFADLETIGVVQASTRRGLWARSKAAVLPKRLRRGRDENTYTA